MSIADKQSPEGTRGTDDRVAEQLMELVDWQSRMIDALSERVEELEKKLYEDGAQ